MKTPSIQWPQTVSAWDIIRHFALAGKGAFAVFVSAVFYWVEFALHCADLHCAVFLFARRPGAEKAPWMPRRDVSAANSDRGAVLVAVIDMLVIQAPRYYNVSNLIKQTI